MTMNRISKRYSAKTHEELFWGHVAKSDGCWEWTAARNTSGYGVATVRGVMRPVHRMSYEMLVGPIPEGVLVLHDCDNRVCVNPAHLHLGDCRMNTTEAWQRGRGRNQYVRADGIVSTCPKGHAFDDANTIKRMSKGRQTRACRTCKNANVRMRRARRNAANVIASNAR